MKHAPTDPQLISSGRHPLINALIALLSGLAVNLCFDPFNLSFLAWFTFVPIIMLVRQRRDKGVFWLGSLFGFGYFSGSFWFLNHIFPGCGFLVALLWAGQPGLWLWLVGKLQSSTTFPNPLKAQVNTPTHDRILNFKQQLFISLASAIIWTTLEWSRSWVFSGLPWNGIEISQVYNLSILKNVSFIGPVGLCFLISFVNTSLGLSLDQFLLIKKSLKENPSHKTPSPASLLFIPLCAVSLTLISSLTAHFIAPDNTPDNSLRVALIQGKFDPYYSSVSEQQYIFHMNTYRDLSLQALQQKPDIIFWPETPLPSSWLYDYNFRSLVKSIASSKNTPMIFGTGYYDQDPLDPNKKFHYNTALGVDGQGKIQYRYNKIHTVPYGEYMPFRYLMSDELYTKVDKLRGMGTSLSAGTEHTIFHMPQNSRIGVNICFDDIFSDTSRGFASNGANILSTITNDSWFHESAGGAQHSAQSMLRAVETGLPLIRSGNTSESMIILPSGEISHILLDSATQSRFSRGFLVAKVPFKTQPEATFYLKYPHLSPALLGTLCLLILFYLIQQLFTRKQKLLERALNDSESMTIKN